MYNFRLTVYFLCSSDNIKPYPAFSLLTPAKVTSTAPVYFLTFQSASVDTAWLLSLVDIKPLSWRLVKHRKIFGADAYAYETNNSRVECEGSPSCQPLRLDLNLTSIVIKVHTWYERFEFTSSLTMMVDIFIPTWTQTEFST
jgi:hypothetical protein